MEFEIISESENGGFILKTSGQYAVEDYIMMLKHLALHSSWKKGMDVLLDHRQTSFEDFSVDLMSQISDATVALDERYGAKRCAIVAPTEGFSKIGMFKFDVDSKVGTITKIFPPDEYADAIRWLENAS